MRSIIAVLAFSLVLALSLAGTAVVLARPAAFTRITQTAPYSAPKPAPASANPITDSLKAQYDSLKSNYTRSAEMMPDKDYGFRPATLPAADKKEIRTFGQLVGHVAEENYIFCGAANGMKGPKGIEQSKTTKADLVKALAESFAFCDSAWASTTDQNGSAPADLGFAKTTRLGALAFNTTHDSEHYGNIVTYLRAKGLVPPSSAPAK